MFDRFTKRAAQSALLVPLFLLGLACSSNDEESEDEEGLIMCCELGALCHVVGDTADLDVQECHELGHHNDPATCRAEYDRCTSLCADLNEEPMEHACE